MKKRHLNVLWKMTTHLAFVWSPNEDFSYFRFLLRLQTQHKKLVIVILTVWLNCLVILPLLVHAIYCLVINQFLWSITSRMHRFFERCVQKKNDWSGAGVNRDFEINLHLYWNLAVLFKKFPSWLIFVFM